MSVIYLNKILGIKEENKIIKRYDIGDTICFYRLEFAEVEQEKILINTDLILEVKPNGIIKEFEKNTEFEMLIHPKKFDYEEFINGKDAKKFQEKELARKYASVIGNTGDEELAKQYVEISKKILEASRVKNAKRKQEEIKTQNDIVDENRRTIDFEKYVIADKEIDYDFFVKEIVKDNKKWKKFEDEFSAKSDKKIKEHKTSLIRTKEGKEIKILADVDFIFNSINKVKKCK